MQQTQPLRCRARNIPTSTKFADCFMQQGQKLLAYISVWECMIYQNRLTIALWVSDNSRQVSLTICLRYHLFDINKQLL